MARPAGFHINLPGGIGGGFIPPGLHRKSPVIRSNLVQRRRAWETRGGGLGAAFWCRFLGFHCPSDPVFMMNSLSLAMTGYLNPVLAALLHNAGSLLVVSNSAPLVGQGENLASSSRAESSAINHRPTYLQPGLSSLSAPLNPVPALGPAGGS